MAIILLSIKPKYVEKILAGTKCYEYRRKVAKQAVSKILVYSTKPIGKVVAEIKIEEKISATPEELWKLTKKQAGISKKRYEEYFQGCKVANAYKLGAINEYTIPKNLADFGIKNPPQSFIYINIKCY